MDYTFIAKLIGIYSVVTAMSMFFKKKMLMGVFDGLFKNRTLSYVLGVLMFILGLIMVLNYNSWSNTPGMVVSLAGWLVVIEGVAYLFLSEKSFLKMRTWIHKRKVYYSIALGYLILGIYMLWVAFGNV